MKHNLTPLEARVIGCLLEKQVTTPEQYPMSLNGITTACNQKTNREPVMELSDNEVQQTLDLLTKKHVIRTQSLSVSRVMKYEQRFCNSEFGNLKFSPAEQAIITTLLLRGAQTPGELRTRTNRLHEFTDVSEVDATLEQLASREDGPFVIKLSREPGKRESRYMHLLSGDVVSASVDELAFDEAKTALEERVAQLELQVAALNRRLDEVMILLDD
ncbi:DUF480 domain-containing protein [Yersinia ruckeri]|uniref:DUF480 domain-containing protein n=1 Tax=Yersinia ruckeri TaxID=29486 RepID=UPI0011A3A668|nr:DUF480 domain-containing protein [Yersinia ruckeri]EKN3344942.1 DUF480 domain-containing protein [Yersinia ruckeri]EKN3360360.1 DUF480 domain-containing protein [Yersinia ruckeri]EKN4200098.1 DUF480 domain-containing protein [Yersinia ruckeri]EKN4206689.1 DUF480 domain-containing protein [Yersinia ruckeri]EKN4698448.1 DUF480 domain-containing protein [Yersinia ruckeri]